MSIPRFKRKPTGMEYVENAYFIQVETLHLASKLNHKWSTIYQKPIEKYACMQADLVNMAFSISPKNYEDILIRRVLLNLSKAYLNVLDKKMTDMVEVLYCNLVGCFGRKNGKYYSFKEAQSMLDKKLEVLGSAFSKQFDLVKGVLESDNKKLKALNNGCDLNLNNMEILNLTVSKVIQTLCLGNF